MFYFSKRCFKFSKHLKDVLKFQKFSKHHWQWGSELVSPGLDHLVMSAQQLDRVFKFLFFQSIYVHRSVAGTGREIPRVFSLLALLVPKYKYWHRGVSPDLWGLKLLVYEVVQRLLEGSQGVVSNGLRVNHLFCFILVGVPPPLVLVHLSVVTDKLSTALVYDITCATSLWVWLVQSMLCFWLWYFTHTALNTTQKIDAPHK